MVKTSIIIVNYNSTELLKNCLTSIYRYESLNDFETIVLDNNSNEFDSDYFKQKYDNIFIINSDVNLGFSRANNLAAQYSNGEFLFFLNPDTYFNNSCLHYFVSCYNKLSNVGCLGSYLVDDNLQFNHSGGSFTNFYYDLIYNILFSIKKVLNIKRSFISNKQLYNTQDTINVDYVSGANLFIKKNTFLNINGFSNDYFMYSEDVDLQKRLFDKKHYSYLIKGPLITHLEGKSFAISSTRRTMMDISKAKYYRKFYGYYYYLVYKNVLIILGLISIITDLYYKQYNVKMNLLYVSNFFKNKYF